MDDERRRKWRETYKKQYPTGFKRRRDAAQTGMQRAAQRRYEGRAGIGTMRRLQRQVRQYLVGKGKAAAAMVGCTSAQLREHLEQTLQGAEVLQWHLSYHRHPREFNLDREVDRNACFHYTNMYARPVRLSSTVSSTVSFPLPSQPAPSPAG